MVGPFIHVITDIVGSGERGGIVPARHAKFGVDMLDMSANRSLTEEKRLRDLRIGATRGEEAKHFALACSQSPSQRSGLAVTFGEDQHLPGQVDRRVV